MTPDHDQHTLLLTLAGVLPPKVKEIYAASHANPAQCAKELQLLTYDLIVMGHEAWKETHLVTPPIKFKRSGVAPLTQLTTWDKEEGHDPDPECNTTYIAVATTTAHNILQPPT